jgi:hypothetical protein
VVFVVVKVAADDRLLGGGEAAGGVNCLGERWMKGDKATMMTTRKRFLLWGEEQQRSDPGVL